MIRLDPEEAARAAALHAQCFADPWSEPSLRRVLEEETVLGLGISGPDRLLAFGLVRMVAGEADLLTLATDPGLRRTGLAARLVQAFIAHGRRLGLSRMTLDVAEDNDPARALYLRFGFSEDGRRRGYYTAGRPVPVDAVLMSLPLDP